MSQDQGFSCQVRSGPTKAATHDINTIFLFFISIKISAIMVKRRKERISNNQCLLTRKHFVLSDSHQTLFSFTLYMNRKLITIGRLSFYVKNGRKKSTLFSLLILIPFRPRSKLGVTSVTHSNTILQYLRIANCPTGSSVDRCYCCVCNLILKTRSRHICILSLTLTHPDAVE